MKSSFRSIAAALTIALSTGGAMAAGVGPHLEKQDWTFGGIFGHFDRGQLQRGFQVYKEICAGCHSMDLVAFRNLVEKGGPEFDEAAIKSIAAEFEVPGEPDEDGEPTVRPAILADRFPAPFPNEQAARASNNGAMPPDLSLIAKARTGVAGPDVHVEPLTDLTRFIWHTITNYQESGPDYLHALLTGYNEDKEAPEGQYYNEAFPGNFLSMAPPLSDELVEYTDGTPMTVEQYSRDVTAFLMWTAEPHLEARKRIGFQVLIFLIVFAGLLYASKRKLWSNVDH
ncbi:cytochrome c1 [Coralliovum pocilloporae]|uniref:cytochrome c1 n=1 Tax=Coralliovum pocilloporae TaxID=3066369 RepID=UPI003D9C0976